MHLPFSEVGVYEFSGRNNNLNDSNEAKLFHFMEHFLFHEVKSGKEPHTFIHMNPLSRNPDPSCSTSG